MSDVVLGKLREAEAARQIAQRLHAECLELLGDALGKLDAVEHRLLLLFVPTKHVFRSGKLRAEIQELLDRVEAIQAPRLRGVNERGLIIREPRRSPASPAGGAS